MTRIVIITPRRNLRRGSTILVKAKTEAEMQVSDKPVIATSSTLRVLDLRVESRSPVPTESETADHWEEGSEQPRPQGRPRFCLL